MTSEATELTSYQRGALVMAQLMRGRALTTTEVMKLTGMKRSGALKLLGQLSGLRECAVYFDERCATWQILRR
jgi:hypothetical protein